MTALRLDVDFAALARGDANGLRLAGAPAHAVASAGTRTVVVQGAPRDAQGPVSAGALLERHARHGEACTDGLRGAWAFAIVDTAPQAPTLLLANDRMAQHGWCWARRGSRFSASPRADAIADGAPISAQAVFTYLWNHVIPSPDTVFEGVHRLPPAHRLAADASGERLALHWRPRFDEDRHRPFAERAEAFRAQVRGAVEREWQRLSAAGAGEVGCFLSGGTDSSTVSGMLAQVIGKVTGERVRAYSIGFDADGYDEMGYARIAARHFGLDHREHYLSPAEVVAGMPLVAGSYDQPFGNSSAVAAYHCARVAREQGCSALLAGDGGDELFGGNARYAKQSVFGWYDAVPGALRSTLLEPLDAPWAERIPGLQKAASYVHQARVPMPDRLHMYNLLQRLGLETVLTREFRARIDLQHDRRQQRAVWAESAGAHLVNRMLHYDWRYTLADNDLPKVCGTTALAGIGTAFPLLADEVIDFSLALPHEDKLKRLKLRWFFKEALRGFLPDEILVKKKQGFGLPFGVWALRDPGLAKLADDAMASFGTRGVVEPGFMKRLRTELLPQHPGYYGELVWIVVMMELWLRERQAGWRLTAAAAERSTAAEATT